MIFVTNWGNIILIIILSLQVFFLKTEKNRFLFFFLVHLFSKLPATEFHGKKCHRSVALLYSPSSRCSCRIRVCLMDYCNLVGFLMACPQVAST